MNRRAFIVLSFAGLTGWAAVGPAEEVRRPRVLGLAHAAFYVEDMKEAVAFYTQFFGYESPYSMPLPSGGELVWIKINDRQSVELFPGTASTPRCFIIATMCSTGPLMCAP